MGYIMHMVYFSQKDYLDISRMVLNILSNFYLLSSGIYLLYMFIKI